MKNFLFVGFTLVFCFLVLAPSLVSTQLGVRINIVLLLLVLSKGIFVFYFLP